MKRIISTSIIILSIFLVHCNGRTNQSDNTSQSEPATSNAEVGLNIGDKAPELVFNNPEGKPIALSSLQGKMVLIDFWAAWCPPCRVENPIVVSAYKKFKDKSFKNGQGFTIYSVSLDRSKDQWLKAIEDDNLMWDYHVSDLKYWNSEAAAIYNVRGIPTNFLIDGDGVIVAKGLRGEKLTATLNSFAE